jgi:hypothetical protein
MIRRITQCFSLLKNIQYAFGRKPRGSNVPTQNKTLEPFSINCLHDNPGARYTPKRLGRGPGSGKGLYSVNLGRRVGEESRDRNLDLGVVLTFGLRVDRLRSRKDCPNMAGSSRGITQLIKPAKIVLKLRESLKNRLLCEIRSVESC